jgi:hypothetical protein
MLEMRYGQHPGRPHAPAAINTVWDMRQRLTNTIPDMYRRAPPPPADMRYRPTNAISDMRQEPLRLGRSAGGSHCHDMPQALAHQKTP